MINVGEQVTTTTTMMVMMTMINCGYIHTHRFLLRIYSRDATRPKHYPSLLLAFETGTRLIDTGRATLRA